MRQPSPTYRVQVFVTFKEMGDLVNQVLWQLVKVRDALVLRINLLVRHSTIFSSPPFSSVIFNTPTGTARITEPVPVRDDQQPKRLLDRHHR